jgi:hypothetical protein
VNDAASRSSGRKFSQFDGPNASRILIGAKLSPNLLMLRTRLETAKMGLLFQDSLAFFGYGSRK